MKKKLFVIAVFHFVFCVLSPFCAFGAKEIDSDSESTFTFPSALLIIEDEAFEGTAVETVVFQNGLVSIGSNAFGDVDTLKDAYIPETTTCIADSAFSAIGDYTIHGVDGSFAEDWAEENGIPFMVDDVWCVVPNVVRSNNTPIEPAYRCIATLLLVICFTFFNEVRSRRPQDRPELTPIDYCFP